MHMPKSAVIVPKRGAQNLRDYLQRKYAAVDFFVLYSSVSGFIGRRGQACYNTASSYLDVFTLYRRNLRLLTTVLDLDIASYDGFVARDQKVSTQFRKAGYVFLGDQTVLDVFAMSVQSSAPPQLVLGLVADSRTAIQKRKQRRVPERRLLLDNGL
ncbi:lovastatin nonaketide synthase 3 [Colletotrichum tofieldiae]|nr:lovastatin nonaketide synthase 3 [Colletotrichum tofieldiae]GKT79756.1 lovastatin nonaketide synthase 3 [Colletotrichum tofieldiae]GKT84329.1 lovastatin nonaketide synthase 3 [Colletotrichum tofieldiae]